ncbi:MAG: nucleoid DNA-binding protein [Roseivirga sp.]|jgi:nucleoid DNA-binding protein
MAKAENKTKETEASVDTFLANIKDDQKKADCLVLKSMMARITDSPAKMWGASIVGFGTYHYKYDSGREGDFMKVGFSPRAQNVTVYIIAGFDRYEALMNKLGKHKTGKSCLYIKKLDDIDLDILEELVKESYNLMTEKYG